MRKRWIRKRVRRRWRRRKIRKKRRRGRRDAKASGLQPTILIGNTPIV